MSDMPPVMRKWIDPMQQNSLPPIPSDFKDTASIMSGLMEELEHKPPFDGIRTGFSALDRLDGFRNSDLILLGGGHLADDFALNLLQNIAVQDKNVTVCFSPQQPAKVILRELLSSMSGRYIFDKYHADAPDCSTDALAPYAEAIRRAPLWVDDTTCISAENIRKKCEELQERTKIDFILVLDMERMWTKEPHVYAPTLMKLKLLAMEMDCPVVVTMMSFPEEQRASLNLELNLEEKALNIPDEILLLPLERDIDYTVEGRSVYIEKHPDISCAAFCLDWDSVHGYRDRPD